MIIPAMKGYLPIILMSFVTENTYEAAYLMMYGAQLVSVHFRRAPNKRYKTTWNWTLTLENVNEDARIRWAEGTATANIKQFMYMRLKIKEKIDKVRKKYDKPLGDPKKFYKGKRITKRPQKYRDFRN